MHVFRVLGRVLHGDFVAHALDFPAKEHHVAVQRIAGTVQVLDVLDNPPLEEELFAFVHPFIAVADPHAGIEEGQFLEAFVQRIEDVLGRLKDRGIGLERRFGAAFLGGADPLDRTGRNAPLVFLLVHVPVAMHLDFAPLRQEVDDGHADAM